jgi:signal transduction histidine kinase
LRRIIFASEPELLIRTGRLLSSSFALLAIYLDPTQPARNIPETYAVLVTYLVYSAYLVAVPSRRPLNHPVQLIIHAIDILVLGILSVLTGELVSPFFTTYTFAVITGAMRWGLTGALSTALILNILMVAVGWSLTDPGENYTNVLIMRSAFALVAAGLLGYFATYRKDSRRRLAQLAAWPANIVADEDRWLESTLEHACAVLGDVRLLVVWNELDEPNGGLAYWHGATGEFHPIPADSCQRVIVAGTRKASFAHGRLDRLIALPTPFSHLLDAASSSHAERGAGDPALCSVRFDSPRYIGRLFVLNPGAPNDDMLSLTDIVAGRIAAELEQLSMTRELAAAASWRERGRLARDLHDSVLQDLTAASLQLKAAASGPSKALPGRIGDVNALLSAQQRRIRAFIESARQSAHAPVAPVRDQLLVFADALARQWQCRVAVDVVPQDMIVASGMATELCQLVSEATANAVRHGGASQIDVTIRTGGRALEMQIADNGWGLTPARSVKPKSIIARVHDLRGETLLVPSGAGLLLAIRLPL